MRIIPVITALLVLAGLYMIVFERETLVGFARSNASEATPVAAEETAAAVGGTDETVVGVVAMRSVAQTVDSAVILRGRTEAARQVTVASETSGLVISEPLRKGAAITAGDILCELDPGTREASLAEARARLAEAPPSSPSPPAPGAVVPSAHARHSFRAML